jgi:hypothetical protein
VAKVEAKKKMEKGPPERQGRLLSGFWTFSLSTTFPEIPLCGPTRSRLWRGRRILRSDSIAGASSGGNDFVPDAVGDVADQDLGPGIVLGGGGGEDVIEEVWWQTWRRRKRWRKGRQNARGNFYQISDFLSFHNFSQDHVFGGGGSGSLKNSAGKYVVENRLVVSVEEEEARKRWEKGRHARQVPLSSSFGTFSLSATFQKIPSLRSYSLKSLEREEERKGWERLGFWTFSLSTTSPEIPSLRSYSLTSLEGEEEERKRW